MKFQVGDRVLVLHSNEEGEVVDIINKKMVMVDVKGVKFPAYIDQLDFPYFRRFTEKKVPPKNSKIFVDDLKKEKKKELLKADEGVSLHFFPVFHEDEFGDELVSELKLHLVNRTPHAYTFKYTLSYGGVDSFTHTNTIAGNDDFYLHDIDFETVNDGPVFEFEFSLAVPVKGKAEYREVLLKPKGRQLFKKVEELRSKGEAAFSYLLFDKYPDEEVKPEFDLSSLTTKGYKVYPLQAARQHLEPAKSELDLHIEKLSDEHATMSAFEKLALQLQTLEKYIDLAIAHRLPWMIVIHGVGTGKLRDEVHEVLRLKKEVKSFVNRYHPAYGYGATEIYFGDKK
jgi:hypothetical protein